jgi:hypothetical protein
MPPVYQPRQVYRHRLHRLREQEVVAGRFLLQLQAAEPLPLVAQQQEVEAALLW